MDSIINSTPNPIGSRKQIGEALVLFSKRLAVIQGEYNAGQKLSETQKHAEEAQTEATQAIEDIIATAVKQEQYRSAAQNTQDPNGSEEDRIGKILYGKSYDPDRLDTRKIRKISDLIHRARLEGAIAELERLDHEPQMFGDWQQVVEDRLKTLKEEQDK